MTGKLALIRLAEKYLVINYIFRFLPNNLRCVGAIHELKIVLM